MPELRLPSPLSWSLVANQDPLELPTVCNGKTQMVVNPPTEGGDRPRPYLLAHSVRFMLAAYVFFGSQIFEVTKSSSYFEGEVIFLVLGPDGFSRKNHYPCLEPCV